MNKIFLAIPGLVAILVIFGVFSSPDSFDSNDFVSIPTTNVLTPTVSNIQSEQIVTKTKSYEVLPDSKKELPISTNGFVFSLLTKAYAVSSSQNEVSITQWVLPSSSASFDPQGNIVTAGANKVGKLDTSTNVFTQWTLPGNLGVNGGGQQETQLEISGFYNQIIKLYDWIL